MGEGRLREGELLWLGEGADDVDRECVSIDGCTRKKQREEAVFPSTERAKRRQRLTKTAIDIFENAER